MRNVKFIILVLLLSRLVFSQDQVAITDSVNPVDVIKKYVEAIGGEENFLKVVDKKITMQATTQGMELSTVLYQKAPNKLYQVISAAGMEQIILFDGEKGFQKSAMGTEELTGDQLEFLKNQASMDILFNYEKYGISYEYLGKVKFNDEETYKIKVKTASGLASTEYYSIANGLKLKEERDIDTPQGTFNQVSEYSDYTEVEGIKIPYKINQYIAGMVIKLTVTEVEINKGIPDSRFKLD